MTAYTSAARQDAYDYIRLLSRRKIITSTEFKREKAKIDKREAKAVALAVTKREKAAAAAAARRAEKAAATAARRMEAKAAKKIPQNLLYESMIVDGDTEATVRRIWKMSVGSTVRIVSKSKAIRSDERDSTFFDITVDVEGKDEGYKVFRRYFFAGSDGDSKLHGGEKIYIMKPNTIEPMRLAQRFRDGITHCVFTPLIKEMKASLEEATSPSTKKRLRQKINKILMLEELYGDGVPEDKMEEVARAASFKISLFDVLNEAIAVYNTNGHGGHLRMTNTRENHVDVGLVVDSDPEMVDEKEMTGVWDNIRKSGVFYMIDGDFKNSQPSKIRTLDGAWELKDSMREACSDFDKLIGIQNYKIDAMKFRELNNFLKDGRIVNGWSCSLGGSSTATACADMPAAYAQFKKCHLYSGFLGHVHQFRSGPFDRAFVEAHLGYYEVIVEDGVSELMRKLGMYEGQRIVLFSPELLYFMNDGLVVSIVQGAWGSRFDFEFTPEMMKDRRYCVWSGRLGIEREETSHTIHASPAWAAHLATTRRVMYWKERSLLTIKNPVKKCFTAHHILGGITSYVRIQMMEAMKQFRPENIVRVVMDGIYYSGEKPAGLEWFKDKPAKEAQGEPLPWYVGETHQKYFFPPLGRITGNALLTGQGGSGKTYSVFNDPGFNNILFVTPSHLLGQDVRKLYGANYTTIHKLIGVDCRPFFEENRVPPVIFVDEITQIDSSWVEKVFKMYPQSLVILAGDVDAEGRWYQCRSGSGAEWSKIWKPVGVEVVEFLEDRRSRDDDLKLLKLKIREAMRGCDLEIGLTQMTQWAFDNLTVSKLDFKEGDTCIAGTHRTNAKLLEKGIVSGYYKKGGFVSAVELPNYEKRGSYSIHSYQGKSITSGKIWICIDDLFEYAMLYTAVSRAVSMDQIRFIKSRDL
jgi:hypothetical protein